MSSFKVKLFVYFLLMAVVPIGAAAWSVSALQGRTQTRIADARLDVELRAALAAYRARLAAASAAARRRARSPAVVRALGAGKEGAGRGGHAPAEATQRITIVGRHGPIGSIRMSCVSKNARNW